MHTHMKGETGSHANSGGCSRFYDIAVLGTNYSSVAVKLLYVSIIPVFVSERFLKAREIRLILALLENQSDQNSVLLSSIFNLSFFLFSSYVHLSFVYLSSFFIFFSYFYSTMD